MEFWQYISTVEQENLVRIVPLPPTNPIFLQPL